MNRYDCIQVQVEVQLQVRLYTGTGTGTTVYRYRYNCIQVNLILTSTLELPATVTLLPAKSPLARLGLRSCLDILLPEIEMHFQVFQLVVYLYY